MEKRDKLVAAYNAAVEALADRAVDLEALPETADEAQLTEARSAHEAAEKAAEYAKSHLDGFDAAQRAREKYSPIAVAAPAAAPIAVRESDMYVRGGRSFINDLFNAQIKNDPAAYKRISDHHAFEIEQRSISSSTLGGIIPPQYLVDMYAKASRNGRVFADQVNHQELPDVGMTLVVPRLTQGLAVASQSAENAPLQTQDVVETDLSVGVKTVGGYVPVSRQGLERAAYSDAILFEDLIARYWAELDRQCLNGSGGIQHSGLLGVSGIATSTSSTATIAGVWPKIADILQQINTNAGGLGYTPDKLFMHPRRWGWFLAALDTSNRPLAPVNGQAFNVVAGGDATAYGGVGTVFGLPVFTDANIPTNLGAGTNEDRIIAIASSVVHLFERGGDPVTLSFEQQAGTSLQVQLVAYGYSAFTAGRYPGAVGAVSGAGLATPTF